MNLEQSRAAIRTEIETLKKAMHVLSLHAENQGRRVEDDSCWAHLFWERNGLERALRILGGEA